MQKEDSLKSGRHIRQRYFCAKELQFSIALLIVLALLGGVFLQAISSLLSQYYGVDTPVLGILLIIGYISIVVLLAVFYTHRLIGPFVRLEYEMKMIAQGNVSKRLSLRAKDDLHIKNFVKYVNGFVCRCEDAKQGYDQLHASVSKRLDDVTREIAKGSDADCSMIQQEIQALQAEMKKFREKR
ncbi:MAG: hypothetical protein HYV24_13005 [Deltaproteobacteria bacterium]|nr:hypothetical protein [Deltaproteobacteria bacterium]MBI5599872.1 hypothetical protein [Deltaproteobacteria bacterium]